MTIDHYYSMTLMQRHIWLFVRWPRKAWMSPWTSKLPLPQVK